MSKFIVLTTINQPTEAVKLWARKDGWNLVAVGDKKTPADWCYPNCHYIAPEQQTGVLAEILPWNHYCRKMLGYLHAIHHGATIIADTDDDNLPSADWSWPDFDGVRTVMTGHRAFLNVYQFFAHYLLWPRGFPLARINDPLDRVENSEEALVGVWQGLADGDPDVDAIFRMTRTRSKNYVFRKRDPIVLDAATVCPFNSQNTVFRKELFPLLYLPATVTFRFTDILRGLVAQPIMWRAGYRLGFTSANVTQERNPHDYMKDFEEEVPMHLWSEKIPKIVDDVISSSESVETNLRRAYLELARHGVVTATENDFLLAWLNELKS